MTVDDAEKKVPANKKCPMNKENLTHTYRDTHTEIGKIGIKSIKYCGRRLSLLLLLCYCCRLF